MKGSVMIQGLDIGKWKIFYTGRVLIFYSPFFNGRHVALDYLERKNIYRKRSRILVDIQAEIVDYVQYQSGDILGSSTVEQKLRVRRFTHAIDNDDVVLEEWCIFRRFTEFSALHKQLRSQVGEQAVGNNIAQKLRDSISINK